MAQANRSAQLSYTEMFTADELTVELDGTTYLLANKGDGTYGGGDAPSSINPIGIRYRNGANNIYVTKDVSAGDHHVVIKSESSSIETTKCFKKAVQSISSMVLKYFNHKVQSATWQEAYNALQGGAMVFLNDSNNIYPCSYFGLNGIGFGSTYIDGDGVYTATYFWEPDGTVTTSTEQYPSQS